MAKQYFYISLLLLLFSQSQMLGQKKKSTEQKKNMLGPIFCISFNSIYDLKNPDLNNHSSNNPNYNFGLNVGVTYSRKIIPNLYLEATYQFHQEQGKYFVDKKIETIPISPSSEILHLSGTHLGLFKLDTNTHEIGVGISYTIPIKKDYGIYFSAEIGKGILGKKEIDSWSIDCNQSSIANCEDIRLAESLDLLDNFYLSFVDKYITRSKLEFGLATFDEQAKGEFGIALIRYHQYHLERLQNYRFGIEIYSRVGFHF